MTRELGQVNVLRRRSSVQTFPWNRGTAGFVAGTLGRVSAENGIAEFLEAAATGRGSGVLFAVAGAGEMVSAVEQAGTNVCYAGFFERPDIYIAQLDVYIQISRSRALSPGLLEAMRAGKPIVAIDARASRIAVTHGESALLVPPSAPSRLLDAVLTLKADGELAARLGAAARARFDVAFRSVHRHEQSLDLHGLGE